MKIIIDCFGGDNSPSAQVEGAVNALKRNADFSVVFVGKKDLISQELEKFKFDEDRVEVLNADEVISCDDKPTFAIKDKKNSSMVVAFDLLKNDDECTAMISSGSTGALLAGSIFKIGRIKGVSRPALTPFLPTVVDGGRVMIVDGGANADCKPINLLHFAIMGASYYSKMYAVEKPRVAILSNGTEDEKGNELTKAAFPLIKDLKNITFCGNIEAREIVSGNVDVVVCDGFSGNIALKAIEGSAMMCMKVIKREIKSGFWSKIGALLMKDKFRNVKNKMDYNSFGGAVVIGVEKNVIKTHGAANARSISDAVIQAYDASRMGVTDLIKQSISELETVENV